MSETTQDILKRLSVSDGNQFLAALHIQMNGFLDEQSIEKITGLSIMERYCMLIDGRFPPLTTIQGNVKGWRVKDIQQWLDENLV